MDIESAVSLMRSKSKVSKSASSGYTSAFQHINPEEDVDVCPISHIVPSEQPTYFSWIAVPYGKGKSNAFDVNSLYAYIQQSANPQDVFRIMPSINYIRTRLELYRNLDESIKSIKTVDVTGEFRTNILNKILAMWAKDEVNPIDEALSVLAGIDVFDANGLVYRSLTANTAITQINESKSPGAFLIRNSSQTNEDADGDCTVFTITFKYDDINIQHIRALSIHGVGVYPLTNGLGQIKTVNIPAGIVVKSNMMDCLSAIGYAPPEFYSISHFIHRLASLKYLRLSSLVRPINMYGH